MNTRKALLIITSLLLLLTGCSSNNSKEAGNTNSASGSSTTIKIATDASYAPMEYMDKDKISGFDIDLIEAVMKEADMKYKITNTGWDTMLESISQGTEYQVGVSSVSITDERKQTYDFSIPYFESINMIMVKEDSTIQNALELADKKVAVQGATTADILMSRIMGSGSTNLKRFDSNTVALMELESGGVDAVVADVAIVREYMKNNPDKAYKGIIDEENFEPEYYGFLYPKGSEYKEKLDPAIRAVLENGTYTELYQKWFGDEPNVEKLLNAE